MTTIVTIAATLGAALRRSARSASRMKKGILRIYCPGPASKMPISARIRAANSCVDSSW